MKVSHFSKVQQLHEALAFLRSAAEEITSDVDFDDELLEAIEAGDGEAISYQGSLFIQLVSESGPVQLQEAIGLLSDCIDDLSAESYDEEGDGEDDGELLYACARRQPASK
jgi:hypothetical protein